MTFDPGFYYVGDPGFVLHPDDLRMLIGASFGNTLKSGVKALVTPIITEDGKEIYKNYWLFVPPQKAGTVYDQDGKGWGYDWGAFGCVPWEFIDHKASYEATQKVFFPEPFECFFDDTGITLGHLYFTFEANEKS